MAAPVEGLLLSEVYEKLKDFIRKCKGFRSLLNNVISKLDSYMPFITEIEKLGENLNHPKEFEDIMAHMEKGIDIVKKCSDIGSLDLIKKNNFTNKLNAWDATLDKLLDVLPLMAVRNGLSALLEATKMEGEFEKNFKWIKDAFQANASDSTATWKRIEELLMIRASGSDVPEVTVGSVQPTREDVNMLFSILLRAFEQPLPDADMLSFLTKSYILLDDGHLSLSLELQASSYKKCWMLGTKGFEISSDSPSENGDIYWIRKHMQRSRFSKVAVLEKVWYFDIECEIKTNILSPETRYAAYLVYHLQNNNTGFKGRSMKLSVSGRDSVGEISLESVGEISLDSVGSRSDGFWMEKELVDGIIYGDDATVELHLEDHDCKIKKSGLIVEGIELRPKPA